MPVRSYATRPVFNWRLPTLAWLNALPPSPRWGQVGLWIVGLMVIGIWTAAIGVHIPRATIPNALGVAAATVAILQVDNATYLHEVWAGLLIAASLGSWALRRTTLSIFLAFLALLIRELALPYVLVMAALALGDSKRREAAAWTFVTVVFLAYWAWHLRQVLANMPAEGLRNAWLVAGGWPFVLTASRCSVFLMFLPASLVAVAVPFAWAGFWQWSNVAGRRIAIVLTAYFAMFMLIGRPDNWYWGFLVAPLIPIGFVGYFFDPARSRAQFS
jgi:hypothetical protein